MKKRKHRIVVEVTFSRPVEGNRAVQGFQMVLDERLDKDASPVWLVGDIYIDKMSVKSFDRVARTLAMK